MQPEVIPVFGAAVITSITAIAAAFFDRFNKPSATICVLVAGSLFWIYFLTWYIKIPQLVGGIGVFGLHANAPLFVIAALLLKSDWRGEASKIAARLSAVGVVAGGATYFFTLRLLAKIP
jgi:hypothetical protein